MNKKVVKPLFLLSFAFCLAFLPPLATFADDDEILDLDSCTENAIDIWSESKLRRYAEDNILYYDDQFKDSCDHSEEPEPEPENPCTPILQGSSIEEKIWNWIATAGIPGVSDNSAVIAGIIGNFNVETGGTYDPFIIGGGGGNYYGFFQTNDAGLRDAFANAGISEYWGSKNAPEDAVSKAIDVTLNYLFYNFGHTPSFLTHLDQVSSTTGLEGAKSYAELFLVAVERGVNGNSMLEDPKVQNFVNTILYPKKPDLHNKGYQATYKRRDAAETIYNKYAAGTVPGAPSESCTPGSEVPGELVSGGMTVEQAKQFMAFYISAAAPNPDISDSSLFKNCTIGKGGFIQGSCTLAGAMVSDAGCTDGTLNNCSAFSQWFVNKYWGANIPGRVGDCRLQGSLLTDTLSRCYGYSGGKNNRIPSLYAVFSTGPETGSDGKWYNHTGVVLGIDKEHDILITGEASCHNGFVKDVWPGVKTRSLSEWTNSPDKYGPTYAYKEGFMLNE